MAEGGDDEDDKTHEPTQRKLDEAIKRGDVAKSIEVHTWFAFAGLTLALTVGAGPISSHVGRALTPFLSQAHQVPGDPAGMMVAAKAALWIFLLAVALPFLFAVVAGIGGGIIQHMPLWTPTPLKPQVSRISPLSGFKRLFGKEALVQFVKGLAKLGMIGALAVYLMWSERERLETLARLDVAALLPATQVLMLKLLGGVLALFSFIAAGDLLYAKISWRKRHRMTQRELKEEFKDTEGSPEIKNKVKQIRLARFKKRMMQNIPQATVVITNPTHYAVALRYEPGMAVPVCVAKGVDSLALRIRQVATEHEVPIIENPPLARALHATVDVDDEIPVEHYQAVAEVIGYVLRLKRRAR